MDGPRFDHLTRMIAGRRTIGKWGLALLASGLGTAFRRDRERLFAQEEQASQDETGSPTVEPTPSLTPELTEIPPTEEPTSIPAPTETAVATSTPTETGVTPSATATTQPSSEPTRAPRATRTPTPKPGDDSVRAAATSSLQLDSTSGWVGSNVKATITGARANERVQLTWRNGSTTIVLRSVNASSSTLKLGFVVPAAPRGKHTITARGGSRTLGTVDYEVVPHFTLSPTTGPGGTSVTPHLSGFAANTKVDVRLYPGSARAGTVTTLKTLRTDGVGGIASGSSSSFSIPYATAPGAHRVEAKEQGRDIYRSITFTVPIAGSVSGLDNIIGGWDDRYCEYCPERERCHEIACADFARADPAWISDPTGQRSGKVLQLRRTGQQGTFLPYAHVLYGGRICSDPNDRGNPPCLAVRPGILQARAFELNISFMYEPETTFNNEHGTTRIQAIEFAMQLWLNRPTPKVWDFEAQWVLSTGDKPAPLWRFFGDGGWHDIGSGLVAERFPQRTWHDLTLRVSITSDERCRYHQFIVDGQLIDLGGLPTYALKHEDAAGNDMGIHVQLDGPLQSPDDYTVYIDAVKVRWYAQPPW